MRKITEQEKELITSNAAIIFAGFKGEADIKLCVSKSFKIFIEVDKMVYNYNKQVKEPK